VQLRLALPYDGFEALAELRIMGVDVHALTGLRVVHDYHPDVRQLALTRILEPHRDDLVLACEHPERPLPARGGEEVGHEEDHGAPLDRPQGVLDEI
jgi:hypothetical protein